MAHVIDIGAVFRRLRLERGEPLRVVAAAVSIDSTLLSRIERGRRLPTIAQAEALANHFGLPVEEVRSVHNAARMLRHLDGPEEALRAAGIIERHLHATRPGSATTGSDPHDAPRSPVGDEHSEDETGDVAPIPPASVKPLEGPRSDRLGALEEAAATGAAAVYRLTAALADPDRVVALRAQDLLRQLRSRIG